MAYELKKLHEKNDFHWRASIIVIRRIDAIIVCFGRAQHYLHYDARSQRTMPLCKDKRKTAITYRFQPEIGPNSLVLHVTMEFKTGADGTQTLELPLQWAGETLHSMTNLHIVSKNASLADTGHSSLKVVHTSPNHLVAIKSDLQKDWLGPLVNPMQFHPVLMPTYLEFTGAMRWWLLKSITQPVRRQTSTGSNFPSHGRLRPALVTLLQRGVGVSVIPEHGGRSTMAFTQPEITVSSFPDWPPPGGLGR